MNDMSGAHTLKAQETSTKDWLRVLAKYRQPNNWRSVFELAITMVGFFGCWALRGPLSHSVTS